MKQLTTFIGKVTGSNNTQAKFWSHVYVYEPTISKVKKQRGNLYIIFEIPNQYEDLGNQIISLIQENYYQKMDNDPLQALEIALSKSNERIEDYNRKLISEKQQTLGKLNIACAVLCDMQLHIAQIGNFYTYLIRRGRLNKISNVSQEEDDKKQSFQNIASGQIEIGDILTLTSAKIAEVLALSQLKEIITTCYPSVAASRITDLINKKNDPNTNPAAIILEVNAEYSKEQEDQTLSSQSFSSKLKKEKDQIAQRVSGQPQSETTTTKQADSYTSSQTNTSEDNTISSDNPKNEESHSQTKNFDDDDIEEDLLLKDALSDDLDDDYFWNAQDDNQKPQLIGKIIEQTKNYFQIVKEVIKGKKDISHLKNTFLILGIVITVVFAISLLTSQNTEAAQPIQEARLHDDIWNSYNKAREELRVNNFAGAKEYFNGAQTKIDELMAIASNEQIINDIQSLENDILIELDKIDGITRLTDLTPTADLIKTTPNADPTSIHNTTDALFILDQTNQQIFRYTKQNKSIHLPKKPIIPNGTSAVIQFATSGGGDLYLYNKTNEQTPNILRYSTSTNSTTEVSITLGGNWNQSSTMTTWTDSVGSTRLYLLDPTQNALWRYRPSGNQFRAPNNVLNDPNSLPEIQNVIDIEIDTYVYFLTNNNEVIKYTLGDRDPNFSLKKLSTPLQEAVAISLQDINEENATIGQKIYLADRGAQQIHIFSKSDGIRLKTYASKDAFTDLRDIYADENASILYVLSGTRIYEIPL